MTNKKFLIFMGLLLSCAIPERYPLPDQTTVSVTGIEIFPAEMELKSGEHGKIRAVYLQDDGVKTDIPFESLSLSADNNIVSFDTDTIVGMNEGISHITVSYLDKSSFMTVTVTIPPDYSMLRISEIMYDPAGDETGKEFIEIFNAGERVCNLEGVSVVDGSKSSNPFVFGSVSLASKSYCAIAQSRDIFIQTYTLDPGAYPFTFALNNTGEAVFLKDPSGNILDSVYIKKGTADFAAPSPWGALTAAEGKALRRKNPMIDTDSPIDFEAADPSPGM